MATRRPHIPPRTPTPQPPHLPNRVKPPLRGERSVPIRTPQSLPGVTPPAKPPLHNRGAELNHGCPDGYLRSDPITLDLVGAPRHAPVLYAVIGTWHEGDIIEATVNNCFANGCDKVFIVDNASQDDTCAKAIKTGASVAKVYATDFYDDDLRLRLMNEIMQLITEREKLPNLWWLSLDADEFPCGPRGERVLDYLGTLHERIDCVGSNAIDLYPTVPPCYVDNRHPADSLVVGMRRKGYFCPQGHWKHLLLRYRFGDFAMAQSRGSHTPFVRPVSDSQLPSFIPAEPVGEVPIFHAPFRNKDATFNRLKLLCTKQNALSGQHRSAGDDHLIQGNGAIKRWRSLEAVYKQEWDKVELPHSQIYGDNITGIAIFDWRNLLPNVKTFPRWYPAPESKAPPTKLSLPLVQT